MRSTRVSPNDAIKEQGRSIVGESRFGFGSLLVVAQVALSLVLIVGAGLFMRTFSTLSNVRLGFEPDPLLIVERQRQAQRDRPVRPRRASTSGCAQAAAAVPGVRSAALQNVTPLTNSMWDTLIENPEGLSLPESERDVYVNEVSHGFFATYGTPILAGRDFTAQDTLTVPEGGHRQRDVREEVLQGREPDRALGPQRSASGREPAAEGNHRRGARRGLRLAPRGDSADDVPERGAGGEAGSERRPSRCARRRDRRRC